MSVRDTHQRRQGSGGRNDIFLQDITYQVAWLVINSI